MSDETEFSSPDEGTYTWPKTEARGRTNARKRPTQKWVSEWDPILGDWRIHRVVRHPETKELVKVPRRLTSKATKSRKTRLLKRYGPFCYLCHQQMHPDDLRVEHKIPWSRGGSNDISNLGLACEPCNTAKGDKTEAEYRRSMRDVEAEEE